MGFLKHLLLWPVTGPMYLAEFSLDKVRGVVREQLTDDSRVKEALLDLQLSMELGEIDEEEYVREEDRLMRELREVRRWREEFGMATRGGVVQVGDAEGPPSGPPPAEAAGDAAGADAGERADGDAGPPDAPEAPGSPATSDRHPPREAPTVPRGATLEVTLDWDWEAEEEDGGDEDEDAGKEDGEWSAESPDDSTPGSS